MEKKKVSAESSVSVNGITLTPIVETGTMHYGTGLGISLVARKKPVALVTVVQGVKKAYRITGEEIAVDELIKEYPGIREEIEKL